MCPAHESKKNKSLNFFFPIFYLGYCILYFFKFNFPVSPAFPSAARCFLSRFLFQSNLKRKEKNVGQDLFNVSLSLRYTSVIRVRADPYRVFSSVIVVVVVNFRARSCWLKNMFKLYRKRQTNIQWVDYLQCTIATCAV